MDDVQEAIRTIGDLQRVDVRPGDMFVLHVDQNLPMDVADRIRDQLKRTIGADAKVLILAKGMALGVVSDPSVAVLKKD